MSATNDWYYADGKKPVGPFPLGDLVRRLEEVGFDDTLVFGPNLTDWLEARHVEALVEARAGASATPPVPAHPRADVIEYEIFGQQLQYVEVILDPKEQVIAEAGAMMFMEDDIEMQSVLGDHDATLFEQLASASQRKLSGESLFVTTFTNHGETRRKVGFAAPYHGQIVPLHLDQLGGELICQKDAFLCAARGIKVSLALQKRWCVGFFGGEGFLMQRLEGDGIAFIHAGGALMHRKLKDGERLRLDTGCLVALTPDVDYSVESVGGVKNSFFGGEGMFLATLTGPGEIWCQSIPVSRMMYTLNHRPMGTGGEGSILGFAARFTERVD